MTSLGVLTSARVSISGVSGSAHTFSVHTHGVAIALYVGTGVNTLRTIKICNTNL